MLNLFCSQGFPLVQMLKYRQQVFEFPAKIEAYQRWEKGLKFTLNGCVCVCVGRPKSGCHLLRILSTDYYDEHHYIVDTLSLAHRDEQ